MTTGAFDPVIHPPVRLQIMAMLVEVQDAEYALLRGRTKVSDSVLSKHLAALVEAGHVRLRKESSLGRVRTWAGATRAGRSAFAAHVLALKALAGLIDRMAAE
ncbi:transcriptional regulator [uncultured Sphingomonas sp.]|uniref:transcriptional regulator n=1 Tax=uncultured Sphingomonas sp. TaxID=158754 RepID=UPI0035CA04AF